MIQTISLFPVLHKKLIELLRSLSPGDWNKNTIAGKWTVRDIAAHLLDTSLRTLSLRDGYLVKPDKAIHSYADLVAYLNKLNADWVVAAKRLSTGVITDLLEYSGDAYQQYLASLDLNQDAVFSVAWAGEDRSKNWFHIAREYTEKWHHQQQIRDAVGQPGIMTRELFYPAIDTFMCGLPHVYRDTLAVTGSTLQIIIETEIGGAWYLIREENSWRLTKTATPVISSSIILQPDIAWKLFTKGIRPDTIMKELRITGDPALAKPALTLVAVIA